MEKSTKAELLEAGLDAMLFKGYNGTGIQEILREVGVPKGSFYHYFGSKEDYVMEVIEQAVEVELETLRANLRDLPGTALERLRGHFESIIDIRNTQKRYGGGDLVGNLAQEMGDRSERFATALEAGFSTWVETIAATLREAQIAGDLSFDVNVRDMADFIYNCWEGALMRMKVERSTRPLELCVAMIFVSISTPVE
jgi:TetR/AcrR family transcriptional repressor of nem operon